MHPGRTLIAILWGMTTVLGSSRARGAPVSPPIEQMDRALREAHRVRVTTLDGRFVVRGVRVDSTGVRWSTVVDQGKLDTLRAPGTVPWNHVLKIEKRAHRGPGSMKAGATQLGAAGALGLGVAAAAAGADINSLGAAFFGGLVGAGVGAIVGVTVGTPVPYWQQVFP
jgi:hypothetical protein